MSFCLTILGSSSALPTSKRFTTAQVLNVQEQFFLIDCGEGTQIQLRKNKIHILKINHIFISHLHGDHYFGLIGLLSTFQLYNRQNDLTIYSFGGLESLLNKQIQSLNITYKLIFKYLSNKSLEKIYENKRIVVKSIPLKHRISTCGFIFEEQKKELNIKKELIEVYNLSIKDIVRIKKGEDFILDDEKIIKNSELTLKPVKARSYAYCSDTMYTDEIIPYIKNIDLLFHEATFLEKHKELANKSKHSTAQQAANIAKKANVKKLLIGHFSSRYKNIELIENEAKIIFSNTIAVKDNDKFCVEKSK